MQQETWRPVSKNICDLALEYQFSDQAAFSRAIKAKYKVTPNEIRKECFHFEEEPFCLEDFTGKKSETQVANILRHMDIYDHIPAEDVELKLNCLPPATYRSLLEAA